MNFTTFLKFTRRFYFSKIIKSENKTSFLPVLLYRTSILSFMTKEKWQGHIAILMTNVIFGLNTPIAKTLVPEWIHPFALTLVRMAFATGVFWLIALFMPKEKVSWKDLGILFFAALFGLIGAQLSFAIALQYTSPVNISLIAAMTPVIVMILAAIFLKEPITGKKASGVFIGACGALLLIWQSSPIGTGANNTLGTLLCIVNIVTYAIYLIITRTISQRYSPVTLMKWMFLFAALIALPLGFGKIGESRIFSGTLDTSALLRLSYIVVMATGVAYLLVPIALKRIRPTTVSMYNNAQPIIASIVAILIGQDFFTWDKPVAAALVFFGVYLVTQSKSRAEIEQQNH